MSAAKPNTFARLSTRGRAAMTRLRMEARFRLMVHAPDKHDVAVIGLRRSGNHAIIEWLIAACPGSVLFLNEALPNVRPNRTRQREWHWFPAGERRARGTLVYSYEDQSLLALTGLTRAGKRAAWTGPARARFDLLILRDPFNMLASRLQWKLESVDRLQQVARAWKAYAAEFLGDTDTLPHKVPVSYNRWVADEGYRHELAVRLGVEPTDAGRNKVSPLGGGSSFDGTTHDGRASEMKVLERWRHFADDPRFRALVADPELHELSARAFGVIPGTEQLRR